MYVVLVTPWPGGGVVGFIIFGKVLLDPQVLKKKRKKNRITQDGQAP